MIQPVGYFKIWRELMTKPIWLNSTPEQKTILITLLAMANYNNKEWEWKGKKYKAKKGQFITSLESIAKNCGNGISVKNVRTALERFEKYEFLANESTNKNRLVTILNWELYQSNDEEQASKQASNWQADGKQRATKEEVKKEKKKEVKKEYIPEKIHFAEFVSMTNVEYETLINTHGKETADQCIEVLDNYKGSSGKKYKSDYRAILSWVVDKVKKESGGGNVGGNRDKPNGKVKVDTSKFLYRGTGQPEDDTGLI